MIFYPNLRGFIMLKISFVIFLFAALCLTGCNFNESNSDSKDIEKFLLLQNNSLRITDLSISHSTILTYNEFDAVIEIPQLKISWKVSGTYDYMLVEELNSDKSFSVASNYLGTYLTSEFSKTLKLRFTPCRQDSSGKSYTIDYTPEKYKSLDIEGSTLPDETLNVDCSMLEGEYKVYELNKAVLNLTNAKNTTVYVTRFNPDGENHSSTRNALKSTDRIQFSSRTIAESPENYISAVEKSENSYDLFSIETLEGTETIKRIHPQIYIDNSSVSFPEEKSRAAASYPLTFEIGDRKTVYAAKENGDINTTVKGTTATLQYKSNKCYVWVVDGYFTDGKPGNAKINRDLCKKFGETLDEVLELERNIFGMESEMLIEKGREIPMETNCETGTIVNILMYDIMGDYVEGNTSGTYGFFTNGDYFIKGTVYNNTSFSNGGKYLHIDTGFASDEKTRPIIFGTIVHEFQHMIHNGQKKQSENQSESVFFDEMCSSLAEDLFQTKLKLDDMYCGKYRFTSLQYSWRILPLFVWDYAENLASSYSNAYGLGIYVAKKYGGADFIYEFMHNDAAGLESFLETIKLHDPTATKESLLRDFCTELCTGKTFNTTVVSESHIMNDYNYPLTSFDFKNFQPSSANAKGPLYTSLTGEINEYLPDQIDISMVQKIKSDSETIRFYGKSEDQIKEYIVIVKE